MRVCISGGALPAGAPVARRPFFAKLYGLRVYDPSLGFRSFATNMLGATLDVGPYLKRLQGELERVDKKEIQRWADLVYEAWQNGKFVFIFGNGGSGTTASHMSEDLGKSSLKPERSEGRNQEAAQGHQPDRQPGLDPGRRQRRRLRPDLRPAADELRQPGDLVIAISGSGNSPNMLAAVDWANRHGLKTFGLTGYDGGKLRNMRTVRPARAAGRHGHGREHSPVPVPLGAQRRLRPHQSGRPARGRER